MYSEEIEEWRNRKLKWEQGECEESENKGKGESEKVSNRESS